MVDEGKKLLQELRNFDESTYWHCIRVARMCAQLGTQIGLDQPMLDRLWLSACLHDIGKLFIPKEILNSRNRLTSAEWDIVKKHPVLGEEMVKSSLGEEYAQAAKIISAHHERIDGKGYPGGLAGNEIPFESKVIAIMDSVDAMLTSRPYKPALTMDECIREVWRCMGTQFDRTLSQAATNLLEHSLK